jgi:hypothetical protein
MRKTTKGVVAIGTGLAVVVGAGVAYAYYTTTIAGIASNPGAATVSATGATALTTSLTSAASNLVPGTNKSLQVTVTNPNAYAVQLSPSKNLHLDFASMSSGDIACTPVATPNSVALFSAPDVAAPATVLASGATSVVTFTVAMADSTLVDQTPCIAKTFNIPVTVV